MRGLLWLNCCLLASLTTVGCTRPASSPPPVARSTVPGWDHAKLSDVLSSTRPATFRAVPATASTLPAIPVVYTHYGKDRQLTPERLKLIVAEGRDVSPAGKAIWFVAVNFISDYDVEAKVVYTPDKTEPRLRKGRYADIRISKPLSSEEWELPHPARVKLLENRFDLTDSVRVRSYVQISDQREVYDARLATPATSQLPFPPPVYPSELTGGGKVTEISDADLIRLIDFARAKFQPAKGDDPICWIVGDGDGLFGVAEGVADWGGDALHIRQENDGFEVIAEVGWADADTVAWPQRVRMVVEEEP